VDAEDRLKRKAAIRRDSKAAKRGRPKKAKKETPSSSPYSAKNRARGRPKGSTKQSIKRVREQRRIQHTKDAQKAEQEEARKRARKRDLDLDDHEGNIIAAALGAEEDAAVPEDFFWEVEAVVGRRVNRGRVEYLIRWKGCSEDDNTWEPCANLCDTAMEEATKYHKALKLKEKQREEDEKKLFGEPDDVINGKNDGEKANDAIMKEADVIVIDEPKENPVVEKTDDKMAVDDSETEVVEDHRWKWTDADQVVFREVERIDVNDPNAAQIVKEARINGTPVVLVGHVGWANFAKRWLTKKKTSKGKKSEISKGESKTEKAGGEEANPMIVDLSADSEVDGEKSSSSEPGANQLGQKTEESTAAQEVVDLSAGNGEKSPPTEPGANELTQKVQESTGAKEVIGADASKVVVNAVDTDVLGNSAKVTMEEKASFQKPNQEDEGKASCIANEEDGTKVPTNGSSLDDLLDLSKQNYELNIKKMIKDIGAEDVPVIKRHYNEEKPIHGKIAAAKFLTTCWPTAESEAAPQQDEKATKSQKNSPNLYLHQWQFPLSDTAGRKLCHQNQPLPKGIMGEDLLKYWLDLPQCKLDSPLQYIFMGREDTLSKLHRDPGGLEISIAPIVGQKECVLVHRADGSNCLYHLTASLEDVDLQRHPLLTQARTWRTIIQPGEILLMPYGTYHQCRNVTPCLSYSRFHLDTVNLLPFVQSLVNGDAPEIDHEEVLWNLTSELINQVDAVFDQVQSRVKAGLDEGDLISDEVVETVNILRTLRHIAREVARREEIRQVVKGTVQDSASDEHNFGMLVDDVDMCLHEFRYRQSKVIPPFKPRRGKALKNTLSGASGSRKNVIKRDMSKFGVGVVAFNTSLENNYMSLVNADLDKHFPNASKDKVGETLIGELVPGDKISVKLEQKHVKAEVIEILPQMKSAYLSFEDYPSVYDEYQPYELLRNPTGAEIPPEDIKPGLVVIDLSNSNEYRAKIQSTWDGPMARVKLIVSQHEMTRIVSPAMILGRYVPRQRKTKQAKAAQTFAPIEAEAPPTPILRPTKVGQMVEVGKRGAARVTKVHGESVATHVDVCFILGNVHSENMIPIDMVQLAPELDPESGRGSRHAAKKASSPEKDVTEAKSEAGDSPKKNTEVGDSPKKNSDVGDSPKKKSEVGDSLKKNSEVGDSPKKKSEVGDSPEKQANGINGVVSPATTDTSEVCAMQLEK